MKMSMYSLDHRTDASPILKGCTCFACKNVRTRCSPYLFHLTPYVSSTTPMRSRNNNENNKQHQTPPVRRRLMMCPITPPPPSAK